MVIWINSFFQIKFNVNEGDLQLMIVSGPMIDSAPLNSGQPELIPVSQTKTLPPPQLPPLSSYNGEVQPYQMAPNRLNHEQHITSMQQLHQIRHSKIQRLIQKNDQIILASHTGENSLEASDQPLGQKQLEQRQNEIRQHVL